MIFGTTNLTLEHRLYTHIGTPTDEVINYLFALVTLLSMLTGLVCNVVVFYYNTVVNSRNIAAIIYRFIAVWDLTVCLLKCPQQLHALLKPELSPFYRDNVSLFQRFLSVFTVSETLIMGALISLLAVTRFIFLTLPMWSYLNKENIKRAVLLYLLIVHIVPTAVSIKHQLADVYWFGPCQWAMPQRDSSLLLLINLFFYLNLGTGVSFSLLTAAWIILRSRREERGATVQSSVTIILMNTGLILYLSLWLLLDNDLPQTPQGHMGRYIETKYYVYYFYYMISTLCPMFLAAYNPLIICVRCSDLRLRTREKVESLEAGSRVKRGRDSGRDNKITHVFSQ